MSLSGNNTMMIANSENRARPESIEKAFKASDNVCETSTLNSSSQNRCMEKWVPKINCIISLSAVILLLVLMLSEWLSRTHTVGVDTTNTAALTVTNVIITPCGNYFWHSSKKSGGNWQPSDAAIQSDVNILEGASTNSADWGYNGVIGKQL